MFEKNFNKILINRDTDKIGFLISSLFHLSAMIIVIGIPSCFQPKTINIPNIIPIEILNNSSFSKQDMYMQQFFFTFWQSEKIRTQIFSPPFGRRF